MTEKQLAQVAELTIRGQISKLPPAEQSRIWECYAKLKAINTEYGEAANFAGGVIAAEDLQK